MATVNERLAALEKKTEESSKTLWRVFEAIYGNGKAGLLTEFQLLRKSVEEHHEEIAENHKRNKADWKWLITTGIAIAAVVSAFFK